jgi:hypothetical protein
MSQLDDKIKELCAKVVSTAPSPELEEVFRQLRDALHEHNEQLRRMLATYPAIPPDLPPTERA